MPAQLAVEGGVGQCPQSTTQSQEGIYITATMVDLDNLADLGGDGILNKDDTDMDGDGILNEYDADIEGDDFDNDIDNCANQWNPDQEDRDGDGVGDICDADVNESADNAGDGFGDNGDNCPLISNTDQSDVDGDGVGDTCDRDADNDGVVTAVKATGSVYLLATGASMDVVKRLDGKRAQDAFGSAIDADADVNNDGLADLVVGALLTDVIAINGKKLKDAGSVYAFAGGTYAELVELLGAATKRLFGQPVIAGVDSNNDDQLEILVGAAGASAPNPLRLGKFFEKCRCGLRCRYGQ